jgi:sortase (surface protein transpeptidase)
MPAASRSTRSLLALALVANLLAASAPVSAGTVRQSAAAATGTNASLPWRTAPDREAATGLRRGIRTAAPATTRSIHREIRADWITRARPAVPEPRATAVTKASKTTAAGAGSGSYKGRNHVWIPALGVSRSVTWYACSSAFYPGNRVYRWGCAGSNNVYLFGHAHSVFKALHDAYVRGRLAKGMKVYYANDSGKVATYAVSWWKLTTPDKGDWAYAAQSSPSLTLQTCVGKQSQYRLVVRLRKVG